MAGSLAGRATAAERLRSLRVGKSKDGYVEVSDRLNAWWEGKEALPDGLRDDLDLRVEVDEEAKDRFESWEEPRADVLEAIWGVGFINPGTSAFARKIMAPARVNAGKKAFELAAGLGGTALMLAREAGVRVDAVEPIESLYSKGRLLVAGAPVEGRVGFSNADFSTLEIEANQYDLIYSRDRLFTTLFKERLMEQVALGLRPKGQFLCSDYVVSPGYEEIPEVAAWLEREPDDVHVWSVSDYCNSLKKLGIEIFGLDDFSKLLLSEIRNAWHKMLGDIDRGAIDRDLVNNVVLEGEIWQSRMKAIEAGGLKLVRINAFRK